MNPFANPSLVSAQYATAANLCTRSALHARFSENPQGWFQWVREQLDLPAGAQVLEVGCGAGSLWEANRASIAPGWRLVLTDFSDGMANKARAALGADTRFRFARADAQMIPFPGMSFDAAVACHMLYHVPDPARALSELRRVIKPGGRLYATTTGKGHMAELWDLTRRFDPALNIGLDLAFTLENGAAQVAAWFEDVEVRRYPDALHVTEAEPLVAYAASSLTRGPKIAGRLPEFRRFLEAELAAQGGVIHITVSSGMFLARRA